MAYTTALAPYFTGPGTTTDGSGMVYEDITVTGAGDTTGTYVCKFLKQPQRVLGPFTYTISSQTVTLSSASLTGVTSARIIGWM